jgi:hypothetical protein
MLEMHKLVPDDERNECMCDEITHDKNLTLHARVAYKSTIQAFLITIL